MSTESDSHVVLNAPKEMSEDALPLSGVFRAVFADPVTSLTAVVGWFGHAGALSESNLAANDRNGTSPSELFLTMAESNPVQPEDDATVTFRLASGMNTTAAARDASRIWYWLCRYRHHAPNGRKTTDALRKEFLTAAAHDNVGFVKASEKLVAGLIDSHAKHAYGNCPFNQKTAEELARELLPKGTSDSSDLEDAIAQTIFLGTDTDGAQRLAQQDTAILLGFMMQRCADYRINPANSANQEHIFHPKLYVVETAVDNTPRTLSIVGSHNWSQAALGVSADHRLVTNTEVSTIHIDPGNLWDQTAQTNPSLGGQLCSTARQLFERSEYVVGSWATPGHKPLIPAKDLKEHTEIFAGLQDEVDRGKEQLGPAIDFENDAPPLAPAFVKLLPHLRFLVGKLNQINLGKKHDKYFERMQTEGDYQDARALFGGKIPASYQRDGAVRLLSILKSYHGDSNASQGEGSRGAFLTDEAGLGKTLIAQTVLTTMAATRLADRHDFYKAHPDAASLKIALLVPAALVGLPGTAGGSPSNWNLHAREIREAIRAVLIDVEQLDAKEANTLATEHLELHVISHGMMAGRNFPDAEEREDLSKHAFNGSESYLEEYQFLAESELVCIDESHTFRNEGSRSTRTLRLLLSLPLPGEKTWKVILPSGEQSNPTNAEGDADNEQFPPHIARRVLNLSATPFNNDIDDLITQIGHFAQYQDWHPAYGALEQKEFTEAGFSVMLEEAFNTWHSTQEPNARAYAFQQILSYARRHLHRTRSLTIDADKQERALLEKGKVAQRRYYDDLGPEYRWEEGKTNYVTAFSAALEMLHFEQKMQEDPDAAEEKSDEHQLRRHQVQQDLESLLTSLFVQRSRIRALRIIDAEKHQSGAAENSQRDPGKDTRQNEQTEAATHPIGQMFRKPRRPRAPLALNLHHHKRTPQEESTNCPEDEPIEAEILHELFRLLYEGGEPEDASGDSPRGSDSTVRGLTMRTYEISSLRGRRSAQGAKNAIGFQTVNLIKRLQSTPYAFYRTLIRGVFRRSVSEIALIERLLEEDPENVEFPDEIPTDTLWLKVKDLRNKLDAEYSKHLDEITGLMGLGADHDKRQMTAHFTDLIQASTGLSHQKQQAATSNRAFQKDWQNSYGELLFTLKNATRDNRILWDPDVVTEERNEEPGWVALLLSEILQGTNSNLWHDVSAVLEWSNQLIPQIWGTGYGYAGRPFDDMWKDFKNPSGNIRDLDDWLLDQLRKDKRSRSLIAWLLLQGAARRVSPDTPPENTLRSGAKTLIFTEYKDTQDYFLALVAALHHVFVRQKEYRGRDKHTLQKVLLNEISAVVASFNQQANTIRQSPQDPHQYTNPQSYKSPIANNASQKTSWAEEWIEAAKNDPEIFVQTVDETTQTFSRVYSDREERALADDFIQNQHQASETSFSAREDAPVDSFSPWYQIEPKMGVHEDTSPARVRESMDYLGRLRKARQFPVHTVLATDVLAEGVNFQECGVIVHYDLPWNPTRLIQRNGRIDRRLNPVYENSAKRSALFNRLLDDANPRKPYENSAPGYQPPEQVYHMSLIPVEPKVMHSDTDVTEALFVTRVRESLRRKLESIRALFGLSNWPVVLNFEDSQEVLTGELDFETPGFRRREDLFAALRQIEEIAKEENAEYINTTGLTSIHLHVPTTVRQELVRVMTGNKDNHELAERIIAAGVLSWTPPLSHSIPVRSDAEWQHALKISSGTLTGILLFHDPEAKGEVSILTWGVSAYEADANDKKRRLLPVILQPISKKYMQAIYARFEDLKPLNQWQDLTDNVPSAPSELADDLMKTIIDTALQGTPMQTGKQRDTPLPHHLLSKDMPERFTQCLKNSHILNIILGDDQLNLRVKPPTKGDEKTKMLIPKQFDWTSPKQASDGFNLWLNFDLNPPG